MDELERNILNRITSSQDKTFVISIDGCSGSGKSFLAMCLCCRNPNFIYFDIDTHYLNSNTGNYLNSLNYDLLKKNIEATASGGEFVVLDAICSLEILERLGIKPQVHAYIKLIDKKSGYWIQGSGFNYNSDVDEIIKNKKNQQRKFNDFDSGCSHETDEEVLTCETMEDEILRYHFKFRPDEIADFIYKNEV